MLAQSLRSRNEIKSRSRGVDESRVKCLISKIETVAPSRDGGLTAIDLCSLPSGLCLLPSAFRRDAPRLLPSCPNLQPQRLQAELLVHIADLQSVGLVEAGF